MDSYTEKYFGYLRQEKRPELCVNLSSLGHMMLLVYGKLLLLKTIYLVAEMNPFELAWYIQRDWKISNFNIQ